MNLNILFLFEHSKNARYHQKPEDKLVDLCNLGYVPTSK